MSFIRQGVVSTVVPALLAIVPLAGCAKRDLNSLAGSAGAPSLAGQKILDLAVNRSIVVPTPPVKSTNDRQAPKRADSTLPDVQLGSGSGLLGAFNGDRSLMLDAMQEV